MRAIDNKWLRLHPTKKPVMTPTIEPVIVGLDKYFEAAGLVAYVTSGFRDEQDQLNILKKYARSTGLINTHPEVLNCTVDEKFVFEGKTVYKWQPLWSMLLEKGLIINPPKPAIVLFNYYRNGVNKHGQLIGASPHFKGTAFDIGDGDDKDTDIQNELIVIKKALKDKLMGLKGFLEERQNNCVHCDCY